MPGPKMGPRPADFNEQLVKQSPTYVKWSQMEVGQSLRYACRVFVKGRGEDEERLMRRIMIARRNNIKDHETLKRARKLAQPPASEETSKLQHDQCSPQAEENGQSTTRNEADSTSAAEPSPSVPQHEQGESPARQHPLASDYAGHPGTDDSFHRHHPPLADDFVRFEMDVEAVESTRSYRAWTELPTGAEFVYNQRYRKGQEGHDWLLRKNIWRRMRYRRENRKLVERLRTGHLPAATPPQHDPHVRPPATRKQESEIPELRQQSAPSNQAGPLNPVEPEATATSEVVLDNDAKTELVATTELGGHDNPASLQASAAAAAAILQAAMLDPAAVEAAVAAAESFRPTEAPDVLPVHDPIAAAAAAGVGLPTTSDLSKFSLTHQEDDGAISAAPPEVLVHDPLQAAALAAQLAAVTGASASKDCVDEEAVEVQELANLL